MPGPSDHHVLMIVCSVIVVFIVVEWYVQQQMERSMMHMDLSIGMDATRCVVHCSHGLGQSADSFGMMFASIATGCNIPTGVRWISHTRPVYDMLDGDDVVSRCRVIGTNALFVGHSLGAIPAVRAAQRWTSLGLHTVGVLLLAPAVDHRDCVWNTGTIQCRLHSILRGLSPGGWQRLIHWVSWCPVVMWWIALSVFGNGWAPLEQIIVEKQCASHGLSSVQYLINRDVGKHFNERLSELTNQNVRVVIQYDPIQRMFYEHKMRDGSLDLVIPCTMIDGLIRRHPSVQRSVLDTGSAGHFPHELQPSCVIAEINRMIGMNAP